MMPRGGALFLILGLAARSAAGADVPGNLVLDVRIFEARSTSPDFRAMESLSFFVNTDGTGVSDSQWLATIARKVPEAFMAALATATLPVDGTVARLALSKRTRTLELNVDLKDFLERGTFQSTAAARLARGDETERAFDHPVELRLDQTYVFSSHEMELSASEYLSHFRDFADSDARGKLYQGLRPFTFFLVVALTPRLVEDTAPASAPVPVTLDPGAIPRLESPLGIPLEGEIVLELAIDGSGVPTDAKIVRSSLPEVNARILGESASFRFPEAAGKKARLTLPLRAEP